MSENYLFFLILFALHLLLEFVAFGLQLHLAGAVPVFLTLPPAHTETEGRSCIRN